MAANAIQSKRGVPGRKIYDTKEIKKVFEGLSVRDKVGSIAHNLANTDREQRIRRNTVHYLMALYYQGYQNVELSPGSSTFDVYERDDFYVENQFRHHVDAVVNSLCKNEGEIVARPASSQPQDIAKARVATPIMDLQKATIGYDQLKTIKNLYKVLFGNAFNFTDYIRDEKYGTIVTPKFSYTEVEDELGGDPYLSKVPAGVKKVNRGREVGVVCSPLEVFVPPDTKLFTNVPYLRWHSRQDISLLNYMYPGLSLENGSNAIDDDLAEQYKEVLSNLPGNVLGDSLAFNRGSSQLKKAEYTRTWLTPAMFLGDKELERLFPEGVHIAEVNGTVVDYYADDLFERWTHEVLIPVPHSLMGDGLYDALLLQDMINEVNSLIIQHIRYSTVGHKLYNPLIIDTKDVENDPANGWIAAKPSIETDISKAVQQLLPGQLSNDVPAWLANVKSAMQDMTSAYDPSIGKGIGANTPYSQSVFLSERAQSRWNASNSYNRPQLIKYHQNLLEIAQHEWLEPRRLAVVSSTGNWSFNEFSQADLCGEVELIMSNTDMNPKSRAEQVQALVMLQQLAPIIPALPPKQKLRVEEMLGMPPDANPMNTQISRAYRHIDRIIKGEVIQPLPFVDDMNIQLPVIWDFMASEQGEDLAVSNPKAYSDIYTFGITQMHMLQMQAAAQAGGMVHPGSQPQPPGGPPHPPQPPPGGPPKSPGGQPGQPGGGPNSGAQPPAQSPAPTPAPPVSPAAA